jgi:hypothetical protein
MIFLLPIDHLSKLLVVYPFFSTIGLGNSSSYLPFPTVFPRAIVVIAMADDNSAFLNLLS